jgi:glycosyltransferase involved in cell wall biosynthesis
MDKNRAKGLLIVTQKVDTNDAVLGFFHRWIIEFAQYYPKVTVICLEKGESSLPANVTVRSLGKEGDRSRFKYLFNFYRLLWQSRRDYDTVFVHMNPIYLVLAGWYWRLTGRRIGLWYTHRQVDLKLRLAEKFANLIFSAAPESFKLPSQKLKVVGHGIDTAVFACKNNFKTSEEVVTILHVGRISQIKNCDILIEAAKHLRDNSNFKFKVIFFGGPITAEDRIYKEKLLVQIKEADLEKVIEFRGNVTNREMPECYCRADLTVNLTPTGGIDKSVLESLSCGVPVFTSNQAFVDYFGAYADRLIFRERDALDLSNKITSLLATDRSKLNLDLRQLVVEKSDIKMLIKKIVTELSR